jgi:hypothetical protein
MRCQGRTSMQPGFEVRWEAVGDSADAVGQRGLWEVDVVLAAASSRVGRFGDALG